MSEEELFCKLFPEYVVNGKPLSPYFDLFESGYEQEENRIAELEKENAQWKQRNETLKDALEHARKIYGDELEKSYKENAELKTKATALEDANRSMLKELDDTTSGGLSVLENVVRSKEQLTKAKELLKKLYEETRGYMNDQGFDMNVINEVYDFIKSEVEK